MDISISNAGRELDELVRRAEAGEEVVLTRDGAPAVRLEPILPERDTEPAWRDLTPEQRMARLRALLNTFSELPDSGVSAARSQDFLYDKDGLPK